MLQMFIPAIVPALEHWHAVKNYACTCIYYISATDATHSQVYSSIKNHFHQAYMFLIYSQYLESL